MGQFVNIKQLILSTLLAIFTFSATAETRYISDDVLIYMHSGPSTQYRIVGTLKAGEAVTFLQADPTTNFAQITTNRNKTAWIDGKMLSRKASLKARTPKLQAELARTKKALAQINNKNAQKLEKITGSNRDVLNAKEALIKEKTDAISTLTTKNKMLTEEAVKLRTENASLAARLDTKQEDEQHRFFMLGALVLGLGLIAGLIIPSIRFRKKKNDGWA